MGLLGLVMSFMMGWAVWYFLTLVARWKVFDKAGIEGWKSLIPIYSDYCTYRISWQTKFYWILMAATIVSGIVSSRISGYAENGDTVPAILNALSTVLGLVVMVNSVRPWSHLPDTCLYDDPRIRFERLSRKS